MNNFYLKRISELENNITKALTILGKTTGMLIYLDQQKFEGLDLKNFINNIELESKKIFHKNGEKNVIQN